VACKKCGNKVIHAKSLCKCCYSTNKLYRVCSVCNRKGRIVLVLNGGVCATCYNKQYQRTKAICNVCGFLKEVKKRNKGTTICITCYGKTYLPPKKICIVCKKNKQVCKNTDAGPLCKKCYGQKYVQPVKKCTSCGRHKKICKNYENGKMLCSACYGSYRRQYDQNFYVTGLLRKRVFNALKTYLKGGKYKKSDEFGINYKLIVKHLGPCPGKVNDYHIDHILPLSAFDFNNSKHIVAAFAPENHQWLKKRDNLVKSAKYDKNDFNEYVRKFDV